MTDTEIREGFLCPICMHDLGTVSQLTTHFEEEHSNEDRDVINQLKGLFNKAKKKILKEDRDDEIGAVPYSHEKPVSAASRVSGIDHTLWEPQTIGAGRSHIDSFKSIRDTRIDRFVIETNKLLIRLDKLIGTDLPTDPGKRKEAERPVSTMMPANLINKALDKAKTLKSVPGSMGKAAKGVFTRQVTEYDHENNPYEKTVVPWALDSDVQFCSTCSKRFNVTRRRHHCRLCGGIMCNKCSQFLPFEYAKKLTNPSFHYDGEGFHRSSSNSSLNSMFTPEGDLQIRTCCECRKLLERRDQQVEQRNTVPVIVQLYEKLKKHVEETDRLLPYFTKMTDTLNFGDTTYSLEDAQMVRMKIMKLYENIDAVSKRILNYGLDSPESPPTKQLQLQRMIRVYASGYLQDNLMGLQSLPTAQEYEKIKEDRKREIQRKIEMEKLAAIERAKQAEQKEKLHDQNNFSSSSEEKGHSRKGSKGFVQDQGWKPSEIMHVSEEDDPMVQQMNNIKGYIKQAKEADRWEEAKMFEENLRELQQEYWRQKQREKFQAEGAFPNLDPPKQTPVPSNISQKSPSHISPSHKLRQALPTRLLDIVKPQKKTLNPFEDDSDGLSKRETVKQNVKSTNPFDEE